MNLNPLGRRFVALLLSALLALALGGCGKKGPLYLPNKGGSSMQQPGK